MPRKSALLGVGVVLLVAGLAAGLVVLARHEPEFYRRLAQAPGKDRKQNSSDFITKFANLLSNVLSDRTWGDTFTVDQINGYFDEDFARNGNMEKALPDGFHAPRLAIDEDRLRLAVRYGRGWWSTVVSVDLRVWPVPKEFNVVALEIQGIRAGLLPVSSRSLLEKISEVAQQQHIDVSWYRYNRNPVALLRFQADKAAPTVQLDRLELHPGKLVICGNPIPAAPPKPAPPTAAADAPSSPAAAQAPASPPG